MKDCNLIYSQVAKTIAEASKDRSTHVGAIIIGPDDEVRSAGFNGFPRGINDDIDERHERPAKYLWTIHAERNAIDNAARVGIATKGCRIYTTLFPCSQCAGSIINAGITEVIAPEPDFSKPGYEESFRISVQMFEEAEILVTAIK